MVCAAPVKRAKRRLALPSLSDAERELDLTELEAEDDEGEEIDREATSTVAPPKKRTRRVKDAGSASSIPPTPLLNAEVIQNNKGGDKLCYQGYAYTKLYTRDDRIRWECSRRRGLSCRGSVVTNTEVNGMFAETEHCHSSDQLTIEATKVKLTMKQQATQSRGRPTQILADAYVASAVEVRAAAGRMESIKRNIRRQRHGHGALALGALPKEPASCHEFSVEGKKMHCTLIKYYIICIML